MSARRCHLVVVVGQEGVGKSTVIRGLTSAMVRGAVLDGEDVGQVQPWVYDEAFRDLHRRNVAALVRNFWEAGYPTVVAGSFLAEHSEYVAFRPLLPVDADVTVVQLLARKDVRDARRASRAKATTQEWRDMVDQVDVQDETFRAADAETGSGYRFVAVDTSDMSVLDTVRHIAAAVLRDRSAGSC
jgi:ABC-type cobalamin/Fe3+-siderophores transport system ATPase subunit